MTDSYLISIIIGCSLVVLVVVLLFNNIAYKNIFKNKHQHNRTEYGFYECGFKSRKHLMLTFLMNAHLVCTLTIIYNTGQLFLSLVVLKLQLSPAAHIVSLFYHHLLFLPGISLDAATAILSRHYL